MMNIQETLKKFFKTHQKNLSRKPRIVVACSGGFDSVALLIALNEMGVKGTVAHINHGLRGKSSQQDERFVRNLSKRLGWAVEVRKRPIKNKKGNLEEKARDLRYRALVEIAVAQHANCILTAHHIDDQIETILLNLMRGSGTVGLRGMLPIRPWPNPRIWIGRPLLSFAKKDLQKWVQAKKIRARQDKSNFNPGLNRNWLRIRVIPDLLTRFPHMKKKILQLSHVLRDEEAFWDAQLSEMNAHISERRGSGIVFDFRAVQKYPVALQRRFLRRAIGQDLLSFDAVEDLLNWMHSPPTSGRVKQLRKNWIVERLSKSKGSPSTSHFWLGQAKN